MEIRMLYKITYFNNGIILYMSLYKGKCFIHVIMFYTCHMKNTSVIRGVKQEHSSRDVRIKLCTSVTTPDLSWSSVVFWAPHFKGLPVEETIRTERSKA